MDRLDAMRTFLTVADCGSFAGAARRLRLSPAAATRAVAQLEDELGLSLLSRTTRSVRLTEPGALYLGRCRMILEEVEAAQQLVRGGDAAPRGTLRVTAPLVFGRMHVLPVVERLLGGHPALTIRLMLTDRIVHLVEEGHDVAVRLGELADSALTAVRVGEVQRVLVASPAYLAERGVPDRPADLHGHDLIASEGGDATNDWSFGRHGRIATRPRLLVNSADAAVIAAEHGCGITRVVSYQVSEAVRAGRLRLVLQAFAPPPAPVSLVYPVSRRGSANVVAFVGAVRAHFEAHPVPLVQAARPASGTSAPLGR